MSRVAKVPVRCACWRTEASPWHCGCGRWKPSALEECEVCSGEPIPVEPQLFRTNAKLTPEDVRWIRHAAANGYRKVDIADACGVGLRIVFSILSGRAWKDVA